jgi:hypothetical protein
MVLLEKLQKLVGMPPLGLVIVFDHEWLSRFGRRLGGKRRWEQRQAQQKKSQSHRWSPIEDGLQSKIIVAYGQKTMRRNGLQRVIWRFTAEALLDGFSRNR